MGNRLFVGNLPWTTTEDDLIAFFGAGVKNVRIITDRETGRSKGFAFVDMDSDQLAEEAIRKFDGQSFGGRDLRVNEATERERRPQGGGGGYGGGGGGYGGGGGDSVDRSRGQRGGSRRRRDTQDSW
mgnify:CR=1 FL=1